MNHPVHEKNYEYEIYLVQMKEPKKKEIVPKMKQSVSNNIHSLNQKKKSNHIFTWFIINWCLSRGHFFYLFFWGRKNSSHFTNKMLNFAEMNGRYRILSLIHCLIESKLCWLALHAYWHSCKVPNKLSPVIIISLGSTYHIL